MVLLSGLNLFIDYIFIILRNQNKAFAYAGFNLVKILVELILAVVLIKYLHEGAKGRINSVVYASLLGFLFAMGYLLKNRFIAFKFSKKWLGIILRRGLLPYLYSL